MGIQQAAATVPAVVWSPAAMILYARRRAGLIRAATRHMSTPAQAAPKLPRTAAVAMFRSGAEERSPVTTPAASTEDHIAVAAIHDVRRRARRGDGDMHRAQS